MGKGALERGGERKEGRRRERRETDKQTKIVKESREKTSLRSDLMNKNRV